MSADGKVVIVVSGGVVQSVCSSFVDLEVQLIDADDLLHAGKTNREIDELIVTATDPLYVNQMR